MQTSTRTTSSKPNAGFTLLEILVVIGLMALVTGIMVPSFVGALRVSGESYVKKLSLILGQARDRAMLTDKLIRLRVDFDKQLLFLEEASSLYLVPRVPDRPPGDREREELEKKDASAFRAVTDLMDNPTKMPNGVKIIQIRSPRYKKPATEGTALVYFFNNGNTDGASLFFETDEKTHWAIRLHPVTGLSRLEAAAPEAN